MATEGALRQTNEEHRAKAQLCELSTRNGDDAIHPEIEVEFALLGTHPADQHIGSRCESR
jgi:hypothetical protein